jgi:hypothetical protein
MVDDSSCRLPPRAKTLQEEQAQLQSHFEAVEKILVANTRSSLMIAASRLERHLGGAFTADAHNRMLSLLLVRRAQQLISLRAYREAGRFPLNREPEAPLRPIFNDVDGSPCAVGYLMLCSGRHREVAAISRANNFVVARDVNDGPLMDWILQSGFTHEEVALIQPFYGPPTHYDGPLSTYLLPGGTVERSGIRFDNFSFSASQLGSPSYNLNNMQVITNLSDIIFDGNFDNSKYFHPTGTNFLALHGNLGTTSGSDALLWHLGFDATALGASKAIGGVYLTSENLNMWTWAEEALRTEELRAPGGSPLPPRTFAPGIDIPLSGFARYQSTVSAAGQLIASMALGDPDAGDYAGGDLLNGTHGTTFSPVRKVHVDLELLIAGNAESLDITNEFTLVTVPEPSGYYSEC